jgi:hypothetical protein
MKFKHYITIFVPILWLIGTVLSYREGFGYVNFLLQVFGGMSITLLCMIIVISTSEPEDL